VPEHVPYPVSSGSTQLYHIGRSRAKTAHWDDSDVQPSGKVKELLLIVQNINAMSQTLIGKSHNSIPIVLSCCQTVIPNCFRFIPGNSILILRFRTILDPVNRLSSSIRNRTIEVRRADTGSANIETSTKLGTNSSKFGRSKAFVAQ
jgi:hypothetical protein